MDSAAADLTYTAKESAAETRPVHAARKLHFAIGVCKTIFLVRRIVKAVLLPDLADSDAR